MQLHREFKRLLQDAIGVSEYVIVINLDIRGFTPFCESVDSLNVATYIKRVYAKILNDFFKNASYYKPTGDGLIIIIPYTEKDLGEVANSTVSSCLTLLETFPSLCANDPMINFSTPKRIGIGVTRGSACCIKSGDKVLDYSGRTLNLASRLMDLARPSGIVIDDSYSMDLLLEKTRKLFTEQEVYLKGIAEEKSIKIHLTKRYTLIPEQQKHPLKEPRWNTDKREYTYLKLVSAFGGESTFIIGLSRKPSDIKQIALKISFNAAGSGSGFLNWWDYSIDDGLFEFERIGNRNEVSMPVADIIKLLSDDVKNLSIKKDTKILFEVVYPVK